MTVSFLISVNEQCFLSKKFEYLKLPKQSLCCYQLADGFVLVNSVLTCLLSTLTSSSSDFSFCSSDIFICILAFKPDTFKVQYLCCHILCLLHLASFARRWWSTAGALCSIHTAQPPKWGGGGWRGLVLG